MKKIHTCLLVSGLVFLLCLLYSTGFEVLWRELTGLGLGLIPFILLEFTAEGVHTLGWRHCLPECHMSWHRLFQIRMAGYALNYLLPTGGLGGEALKASLLFSDCRAPEAVSAVLTGKLSTGISQLLFILLGSLVVIGQITLSPTLWVAMICSTGLVVTGMLGFFLLQKYGKLGAAIRWMAGRHPGSRLLETAASQVNEVDAALTQFYRGRPLAFVWAVTWQMGGHSIGILQAWWFLSLLHLPATFTNALCIWVLGLWFDLITFSVPLNIGTLEGSRMIAFKAVGLGTVPGMTYGIALRLAQLSCAALGLVYYSRFISGSEKTQICAARKTAQVPPDKLQASYVSKTAV